MSHSLLKIGAPPKCSEWAEKLHDDFSTVLKPDKEEMIIEYGWGTRQGDLATNLFIIMLQRTSEDTRNEFRNDGADVLAILCDPSFICTLKLHHCEHASLMINTLINLIACVDDGACIFNNIEKMLKVCEMACKVIPKWG